MRKLIYQVYFVEDAFKEVIDEAGLERLLFYEESAFRKRQLSYFFKKISPSEVYETLKNALSTREDIEEKEEVLTHLGPLTHSASTCWVKDDYLWISSESSTNVFFYALKALYPTAIFRKTD